MVEIFRQLFQRISPKLYEEVLPRLDKNSTISKTELLYTYLIKNPDSPKVPEMIDQSLASALNSQETFKGYRKLIMDSPMDQNLITFVQIFLKHGSSWNHSQLLNLNQTLVDKIAKLHQEDVRQATFFFQRIQSYLPAATYYDEETGTVIIPEEEDSPPTH